MSKIEDKNSNLDRPKGWREYVEVFQYSRHAIEIVWSTSPRLTIFIAILTLIAGILPAGAAYVGKLIVDGVILAKNGEQTLDEVLIYVVAEAGLLVGMAATQRGLGVCTSLLRAQLGHTVNVMILKKALTLTLPQFEDSAFYDKLTRARREASSRPLSLISRTFHLIQNLISLLSFGLLLVSFSPYAMALIVLGGIPSFLVEAKFSGRAYSLFRRRSPESRRQAYFETVLAREDYAKEVQLYNLGGLFLDRYKTTFEGLYVEDRDLTLRRGLWGGIFESLSTLVFYFAYAWVVIKTIEGGISLGEMTMYLMLFRRGQSAITSILSSIGKMYEDNLYLSTLYEYLNQPATKFDALPNAKTSHNIESNSDEPTKIPSPGEGIRFEHVRFRYPGSSIDAISDVSFDLKPGETLGLVGENGSGKTTLIKLLTGFYQPQSGRVLIDGLPVHLWEQNVLRNRIATIFQDFARYHLIAGENIGVGKVDEIDHAKQWKKAALLGKADQFIADLPKGYQTQLGKWFNEGQELSGGQWQKIALARTFMRTQADILILDEPTSALDAEAESEVFDHVREHGHNRMIILISHRFSTMRSADRIMVLANGKILEQGSHDSLISAQGRYAHLFSLQARGYQ